MLTGQRRTEVGGMRWREVDLDRGVWILPKERTKNHREHVLPLPPLASSILESVPHVVNRDCVFGQRSDGGFTIWAGAKAALDARLGEVRGWTLHDLRRSCATGMANLGVQPHVIEVILNHASGFRGGVGGTYNRSPYERVVKAALALWADHIRTIVEGGGRKVVPIRRPVP